MIVKIVVALIIFSAISAVSRALWDLYKEETKPIMRRIDGEEIWFDSFRQYEKWRKANPRGPVTMTKP